MAYVESFVEGRSYQPDCLPAADLAELEDAGVVTRARGSIQFRMVGAACVGGNLVYVVPKFTEGSESAGQFYVRVIKAYLKRATRKHVSYMSDIPAVMRTFEELNSYYLSFGMFKERRIADVVSQTSNVNWSKTLSRNDVVFSRIFVDGLDNSFSAIYSNPVTSRHVGFYGKISGLFSSVLSLLATFIAPILNYSHPLAKSSNIDTLISEVKSALDRRSYYKKILSAHIASESGCRKRILRVLYSFLASDVDGISAILGKRTFIFGTSDFENIWEDACVSFFGGVRDSSMLAQPTLRSDYGGSVSTQRIDGLVMPENEGYLTTILDAKYYDTSDAKLPSFPLHDIMKQYGYSVSLGASLPKDKIRSCFVIPWTRARKYDVLGEIGLEKDDLPAPGVPSILIVGCNPDLVFRSYVGQSSSSMSSAEWLTSPSTGASSYSFKYENSFGSYDGRSYVLHCGTSVLLNKPEAVKDQDALRAAKELFEDHFVRTQTRQYVLQSDLPVKDPAVLALLCSGFKTDVIELEIAHRRVGDLQQTEKSSRKALKRALHDIAPHHQLVN
jgi:LlaJI restriction endonuclease.